MTALRTAETVMRPASAALEAWFPAPGAGTFGGRRQALTAEQTGIAASIASTVSRMGAEADLDLLDALTDEVASLLARAEEIRLALALAARASDETWLLNLELD
jgi:hypothetical protein